MSGEGPTDDDRGEERGDERKCSGCGEPLQDSQDWCLKCGAAARKRRIGRPGWRSAATVIGASLVLALGAAAAAYAALNESSKSKTSTVASTPATPTPGTTTPGAGAEGTVPGVSTPGEGTAPGQPAPEGTTGTEPEASGTELPKLPANPPSIPGSTPTPSASETGGSAAEEERLAEEQLAEEERLEAEELQGKEAGEQNTGGEGAEGEGEGSESLAEEEREAEERKREEQEEQESQNGPSPILLDTNAAQLYNPNEYPESRFGDPSLTIDGEATTVWKAKVNPETAPKMAVGLAINLKADLHVSKLTLITNTKGMRIQVYGTKRKHLPKTITSKGWVKLSGPHVVEKHKSFVNLRYSKKQKFRQILIWFVKAPSSSTPEEPGHIAVNELELYEPPAS